MSSSFSLFSANSPTTPLLIGVLTTLTAITVTKLVFRGEKLKVIKSPETTLLPKLSAAEIDALPYPPDALPGGRSVESPVSLKIL
jgi:hypothetical protein